MGLMVRTRGIMEWLMRLLGFETLCYSLTDDPDLVAAASERIGKLVSNHVRNLSQLDGVSAIVLYDDMGFRTNAFISPRDLRDYVLPWTKACAAAAHDHSLPFILHACGNLEKIMDDLIDDVGIDARHSFEDIIMPMAKVKAKYGERIGVLGGVDMHILAAGSEEAVRAATQEAIEACAPGGGYAFGSGNTIANYIPLKNYFAMLDEAKAVGWAT
jgi:uroporphyrinogen decarboxylase